MDLLLFAATFWALERLFGPEPRASMGRDTWTDVLYWFVTPAVAGVVAGSVVALAAAAALQPGSGAAALVRGSWAAGQPWWLQAILALVVLDFLGYWLHRAFHRGRLWRFHAIHHGPRVVTWLSSVRLHPVNDVIPRAVQISLLLGLGLDPAVLAGAVPGMLFWTLLLHARVPWRFGPLRFVFASPAFHRWHHACEAAGRDKNFAGFLPIWDLAFGTYYLPDRPPRRLGVDGEAPPDGLLAQMVWPFRRGRPAPPRAGMLARDDPPAPAQQLQRARLRLPRPRGRTVARVSGRRAAGAVRAVRADGPRRLRDEGA